MKTINNKKTDLITCLEALNVQNHHVYRTYFKRQNRTNIQPYHQLDCKNYKYDKHTLWLIYNILNTTRYCKNTLKKIFFILMSYSNNKSYFNNIISLITYKYIKRFIYKYQKYHKYDIKHDIYQKDSTINKLDKLALINLYIIYKLLRTKNNFFIYKNLTIKK